MTRRLFLIFFGDFGTSAWWTRALRPGFRHVCAAAYFAEADRWLFYEPTARGLHIEIEDGPGFDRRYADLMTRSTAVLRFASREDRRGMPALAFCVGEMKALLGVRCCAVTPYGLMRALIRQGAEIVVPLRKRPSAGSHARPDAHAPA